MVRAEELRAVQAPLKQRYRDDPAAAVVTLRADGELGAASVTCKVSTGRALVEAGLHPATGGDGVSACSGDMLLEALVACAGVTLRAVATALDLPVRGGRVSAEGDLDFRGTLGVARDAPVGFRAIRLRFALDADLTPAQLRLTPRERALQVFAQLGVWDTEENSGVLIYVQLIDRDIEIVADRGIARRVQQAEWEAICRAMEEAFRRGAYEEGAIRAIESVTALLARHFPPGAANPNELPDKPAVI
jgi:uncharacterized OsmC-like protein